MSKLLAFITLAALPLGACAQSKPVVCAPDFTQATVRVMPVDMPMQAGYVSISNPCKTALEITGVSSPVWQDISLHSTQVVNGVSKMRALPVLKIAAGSKVQMAPGGSHIMLMDPKRKLKVGESVELTFKLRDGRAIKVPFALKAI